MHPLSVRALVNGASPVIGHSGEPGRLALCPVADLGGPHERTLGEGGLHPLALPGHLACVEGALMPADARSIAP